MDIRTLLLTPIATKIESVDTPIGKVHVRCVTAFEKDQFEIRQAEHIKKTGHGLPNVRARMVVMCACDETGAPLFTGDDVPALAQQAVSVLEPICNLAAKLNSYTEQDLEALGND